jgi:hypothetical protein
MSVDKTYGASAFIADLGIIAGTLTVSFYFAGDCLVILARNLFFWFLIMS